MPKSFLHGVPVSRSFSGASTTQNIRTPISEFPSAKTFTDQGLARADRARLGLKEAPAAVNKTYQVVHLWQRRHEHS